MRTRRPATEGKKQKRIIYAGRLRIDSHFKPVDSQDEADLARVVFTDDEGGTMFLVPKDIGL